MARLQCGTDKLIAGVVQSRRTRVGDEGYIAVLEPFQDRVQASQLVVLVIAQDLAVNVKVCEKLASDAGVLSGDQVDLTQGSQGPDRDVLQIADRCSHQEQRAHEAIL